MINLRDVMFKYDDKVVLDHINLDIERSRVTFIIGSNGCGKSTLANIISGLLFPKEGKVYIDDVEVKKNVNNKDIRKKIGMVFQNPSNQIIFPNIYDDISFTLENMKTPKNEIQDKVKESLKIVGMLDYINANSYNLSGGQKQRIAIASQLSLQPDYLIFDEATSMIDINGRKDIYNLIKTLKNNMGIIFITNNMDELIYADDIIIIDEKKVYKYTLLDILKENSILIRHKLNVPFIFKIAKSLKIKDIADLNEKSILERLEQF